MKYKHLLEFKKYTKMTDKATEKYPVDYKCTFIYDIAEKLEKRGIDVYKLGKIKKTKSGYEHWNSLYEWINKKLQADNTIYPNQRTIDLFPSMTDYKTLSEGNSVVLLPIHYDSSKDEEIFKKEYEISRNKLIEYAKNRLKTDEELQQHIKDIDANVDFGVSSFEWVNIALDAIYEDYKQYYVDGYLKVWLPQDWDYGNEFAENEDGDTEHDYPIKKMIFLSELEDYLKTNYGLSDNSFYEYIIANDYIEGRYWEIASGLCCGKDYKFPRKNSQYGMDATPEIDKMLGIIETEFIDIMKGNKEYLPIYVDYFKKIKDRR